MSNLTRVSKQQPCGGCGKDSWCFIGKDDYLCMRVPSDKSVQFSDGTVAFLHPIGQRINIQYQKPEPPRPEINCPKLMEQWQSDKPNSNGVLATDLGVSETSLNLLGCCRSPYPGTWAFPMRLGDNTMVGIRLRHFEGKKWAERGSKQGLFIPQTGHDGTAMICEGPTDTAAAITLGYFGVGRPSCNGGLLDVKLLIKRRGIKRAIIMADIDSDRRRENGDSYNPGIDGAVVLSETIGIKNVICTLPAKDLREFVKSGGSKAVVECIISSLIWRCE